MAENYFKSIRAVAQSIDERTERLQSKWKIPHLLLCNNENNSAAQKLADDLRNEIKSMKDSLAADKETVLKLTDAHVQFVEESTKSYRALKDQVDEIKTLFIENGYVEECVNKERLDSDDQYQAACNDENDCSILNLDHVEPDLLSSLCESSLSSKSSNLYENLDVGTPKLNDVAPRMSANAWPKEAIYSPYFHKLMKKK